ncbi:unnamed protein product, partial [Rotaria magnacalcarata]
MKKEYVPDGWLGFILGTRLYIDFGTYEFEQAMKLLDSEIQLQKKKRKEAKLFPRQEATVITTSDENRDNVKEEKISCKDSSKMKSDIFDWTEKN